MSIEFVSTSDRKARRARLFARFAGDRRGSTALEFALLALPFAVLVFAILESCISFAGQEVMANITDDIARKLRTGQLRPADVAGDKLKTMICDKLKIIVSQDCPNQLDVDLRAYTTFADAATASFKIENGEIILMQGANSQPFATTPGLAESKNMLRVFYKWPVMTDLLAQSMGGNKTLHFASVTWQNEPFDN
ncbi:MULTISPECIES: TadE/TadG family type IV pilus assembly protein [unclassified Mesorhizobium]|uniref:TadE/TadG family type IV pilus assembly protein n=1 Tax=unclassified Mesorhizobium TaxID=325217 RepID=UPI00112AB8DC|nr:MULTISPECIES: TadE/TadG family type IV pilus assembly protein [unclassified Mesorhizobium]TPJ49478.1 pilus assembly protein [Mesorhizobium sp. B2-6-6]MBZ9895764.1 pilus assembly protein [Mesorhizobium sp. BR1-1-6]MBZ9952942.1 pilus assembly protein [Mesorhizobium sp. BR1-1-15]MBZ9956923.1 pilus assembly protein [Mesorhizobium sp. BR1-1-14]MCA0000653.1 pilus assembly protein [Mesorhizobium sp. B264B2A]